ncbi:FAD-dependent monooxygenase [Nonomuraea sp. NPDC059007]|uniref:FAD-dependent monooxygenase n=1 Tax=Nonomuraea sp. NPDC059007 TaxID=3346692 RepID=UPI0036C3973D
MYDEDTPVLIVGGAVVGLSAALFLAHHGVCALLVDKHPSTLRHPRCRAINPRTVEIYRQAGLEERIFAARSLTSDMTTKLLLAAETVAGPEKLLAPMTDLMPALPENLTPCTWCSIDQDKLEEVIRARAEELGADLRYSTELVSFEQDQDGVTALCRGPQGEYRIRSRYLIAADGHRSPVREALTVGLNGPGTLGSSASFVFKADLGGPLRGRDVGLCYLDRPRPGTFITPLDDSRWVFYTPYSPQDGERIEDFDDERCRETVREAIGVPHLDLELEPQLVDGTKVLGFEVAAQVVEQMSVGRVFLAGDAAHAMPPSGALGASTGVQDAHNLAWKLAAVLDGSAGPSLLGTYDQERRPVAQLTVERAMAESSRRKGPSSDDGAEYSRVVMGYRYDSAAIIADEQVSGLRAPHVPLGDGGSTVDLLGSRIVLLTGDQGESWTEIAQDVAKRLEVKIEVQRVSGVSWTSSYQVGPQGAVLVRPDGFVAWRCASMPEDADGALEGILRRLLGKDAG